MGSSQSSTSSKSEYGDVKIEYENNVCVAGSELRGTLVVNILKPYPLRTAEVIAYGEEVVMKADVPVRMVLLSQVFPFHLPHLNGVVQPGRYVLPFSFLLPIVLPGSLSEEIVEKCTGTITYSCSGQITSSDPTLPTMRQAENFIVKQPLVFETNCALNEEKNIKGMLWVPKGKAALETVLGKNGIHSDEPMNLSVNIDCSKCSVGITEVKCYLYEETKFLYKNFSEIVPVIKKTEVASWMMSGVKAGDKIAYVETLQIPYGKRNGNLETVSGTNIQRRYYMEIVPMFDVVLGDKKMKLTYVLNMTSLPSQVPVQPVPPPIQPMYPVMDQSGLDYATRQLVMEKAQPEGMDGYVADPAAKYC